MNTLPDTHVREASGCPSPVTIWQTLLTRLLDQHYGLTLNDTPFADERVIEQHIEAGISLCDAVNFLVEKYALVRTDQPGFSAGAPSQLINSVLTPKSWTVKHEAYRSDSDIQLESDLLISG